MYDPRNPAPPLAPKVRTPLWETLILVGSFVALWAWYLLRQSALRAGETPSPLGSIILIVTVPLLVWVFARRMSRILKALRETHPAGRGPSERN